MMAKSCPRWFARVIKRPMEVLVRRVHQMEDSLIRKVRRRPWKTIDETIKKELTFNDLSIDMVYDRT